MKRTDWIRRPYHLLLLTAIVLFIASFFYGDETFDIHLHDTYYVIAIWHLLRSGAMLLSVIWLAYLIIFRWLNRYLTWIHLVTTFLCIGLFVTLPYWLPIFAGNGEMSLPHSYLEMSALYNNNMDKLQAFVLFAIAGQLFFVANICYAIAKFASRPDQSR
jgi:heme/copper-type cytochrome/quinol oxidase subunit 1